MKWRGPNSNGALLKAAEEHFDALITTDQNLAYQQDLTRYRLAILLVLPTTSWPKIRDGQAQVVAAVDALRVGDFVSLSFD